MRPQINVAILALVLVTGFLAGWILRGTYKPVVHVVVDDIPFISGSDRPKPTKTSDCGTAEECMKAATCEAASFTDSKTHKLRFPKECADYFAKKRAVQSPK